MSAPGGLTPEEVAKTERSTIAADIERARARVAASLSTLGEEVTRRGDWRAWIRARPAIYLVGAFALGYALAGGGKPPAAK
jgi:hypothetical protein